MDAYGHIQPAVAVALSSKNGEFDNYYRMEMDTFMNGL